MEHVLDCIRSFARFESEDGYDIYILHSDLQEQDQIYLSERTAGQEIRLHFQFVDPVSFESFPESARYPRLIYYRIFAASLLPDELDRILYLDGDKIGILDTMKYNLSDRMIAVYNSDPLHEKVDLEWVRKNAVIIHYYGKQKPWKKPYLGKLDVFYRELKAAENRE